MNIGAFNPQPTLSGKLLTLRPLRADDFEVLFAAAADPLLWEQHPQFDRYKREVFEKFFEGAMASGGAFLALDQATGEVVGSSRFYDVKEVQDGPAQGSLIIGYTFLRRSHWRKGFNREMKALMLGHAFQSVDTVFFQIGENNRRSRTAIEAIGARLVDRCELDGKAHVIYRIEARDFRAS